MNEYGIYDENDKYKNKPWGRSVCLNNKDNQCQSSNNKSNRHTDCDDVSLDVSTESVNVKRDRDVEFNFMLLETRAEGWKQRCDNIQKTLDKLKQSHKTVIKQFAKCHENLGQMTTLEPHFN